MHLLQKYLTTSSGYFYFYMSKQFDQFVTRSILQNQCRICLDPFTSTNFPVVICRNQHFVCRQCRTNMIRINHHRVPGKTVCPFCRQANLREYAFIFKVLNQTIKFKQKGFNKLRDKQIERQKIRQKITVLGNQELFLREGQRQKLVYKILIVFLILMLFLIISSIIYVFYLSYEAIQDRITLKHHLVIFRFTECYQGKLKILKVRQLSLSETLEMEFCWKILRFLISA